MNYLDSYKSMLLKRGGNVLNSDIKNSKDSINKQFKNDYSYKLAILKKKDKTIADSELDTRIVNNTNDKTKKNIYVRPDTIIEVGDYIIYPNKTYLVLEVEDNLVSPYAKVTECNYLFKWMYKGVVHSAYGIGTNQTKYTLGTSNLVVGITESDSRYSIDFPNDINCKTIKVGQRFIFNDGAWKVAQIDYISSKGLLSILLGQDSINENDDFENEIADRWIHNYTISLSSTSQEIQESSTYQLNPIVKDNNQEISNKNVVYKSSNPEIATVDKNGLVTAFKEGNCIISCSIGEAKVDLILNIIAKNSTPIINYTTSWTNNNGSLLRLMSSTTVSISKTINNIIDTSLVVNYRGDKTFQSLIEQKKLTITKVSDTSYTIKNTNTNTTTNISIEFIDASDGTVIETKQILLKGV